MLVDKESEKSENAHFAVLYDFNTLVAKVFFFPDTILCSSLVFKRPPWLLPAPSSYRLLLCLISSSRTLAGNVVGNAHLYIPFASAHCLTPLPTRTLWGCGIHQVSEHASAAAWRGRLHYPQRCAGLDVRDGDRPGCRDPQR